MTKFKSLEVSEWRQFGWIEIEFHPQMTVITGANGAGKTTLLNILSQHFGWTQRFVGTLRIDRRGARKYYSGVTTESSRSPPRWSRSCATGTSPSVTLATADGFAA